MQSHTAATEMSSTAGAAACSTVAGACSCPRTRALRPRRAGAAPTRRSVAAAGEGRSANRAKWAASDLAGNGAAAAAAAVLESPAQLEQQERPQLDASELVRCCRHAASQAALIAHLPTQETDQHPMQRPVLPAGNLLPRAAITTGVVCGRRWAVSVCRHRPPGAYKLEACAAGDAAAPHRPPPLCGQHRWAGGRAAVQPGGLSRPPPASVRLPTTRPLPFPYLT